MNNGRITEIAQKLGVSNTTVSKVIRHCGTVDSDTRLKILREIQDAPLPPESHCDIYCILPDIPHYFWEELRRSIDKNISRSFTTKINIYTRLVDEETVLLYLSEAEKLQASVIILSTQITNPIHEKLKTLLAGRLIILLSEQFPLTGGFYVGSDPFSDGYAVGQLYANKYRHLRPGVIRLLTNPNAEKRIDGFLSALSDSNMHIVPREIAVTNEAHFDKTNASHIAKLLSQHKADLDLIYSSFGNLRLPLALRKAGFAPHTVILAHDTFSCFDEQIPSAGFHVSCNQDLYTQGLTALRLADTFLRTGQYPSHKNTYIPSAFHTV